MNVAVAHFIADPVAGAGMAVKSLNLCQALVAGGIGVVFITTDVGLDTNPMPDLPGTRVVIFPSRFRRFPMPRASVSAISPLVAGCDAVFLMNHWTMLNAPVYLAARRTRRPYAFCPGGALKIQGRSILLKRLYQAVIGRHVVSHAAAVVATTPLEARQFLDSGVPSEKIVTIPNGVHIDPQGLSAAEFRSRHGLGSAPFVLFMGRLNAIKGPDLLLDAFAQVASRFDTWRLVVAGRDEGLDRALRARSAALGLSDRVKFVGHLDAASAIGAYRAASLLAVPSRHEAMSLVALEAGVQGTPVLLTDECGFDDVERVGGGLVVPPTVVGLAAGIQRLIARPDALPAMGTRLRSFVVAEFGWPAVAGRYLGLLDRMTRA